MLYHVLTPGGARMGIHPRVSVYDIIGQIFTLSSSTKGVFDANMYRGTIFDMQA
jgi:hypothetical protein